MENHEQNNETKSVNKVGVRSKNSFPDINSEPQKSVEDSNCNLTILASKDISVDGVNLIQSCGESEISLNGPVKLFNGIENIHIEDNNCSSNAKVDNTSHFESIVESVASVEESLAPHSAGDHVEAGSSLSQDESGFAETFQTLTFTSESNSTEALSHPNVIKEDVSITKDVSVGSGCTSVAEENVSDPGEVTYVSYESELQMPDIMRLIQKDLSEPYSIYTYRYFIHNWPQLCFLAMDETTCVGAIVCKLDMHRKVVKRGYIAMLAVDEKYRKRKIGSNLVLKAIRAMVSDGADEVVLETEITNKPALRLYENLGFVRDKRLFRYYLNGVDALRLKLWLR